MDEATHAVGVDPIAFRCACWMLWDVMLDQRRTRLAVRIDKPQYSAAPPKSQAGVRQCPTM
jgi:hypothetical protein